MIGHTRYLHVLAYSNGFTHWVYQSPHPYRAVVTPGYFDDMRDQLSPGDQITVSTPTWQAILAVVSGPRVIPLMSTAEAAAEVAQAA